MTDLVSGLATVAAAMVDGDDDAAEQAWKSLPVGDRGLIAALVLAAADRDVNQKQISDVGRFSRSLFTPSDKPSRRQLAEELGLAAALAGPIAGFLLGAARPVRTLAEAETEVRQRDHTISDLRSSLARANADREVLAEYARSLHERLYPEVLENLRTREERVIDARPRLVALNNPTDDTEDPDGE